MKNNNASSSLTKHACSVAVILLFFFQEAYHGNLAVRHFSCAQQQRNSDGHHHHRAIESLSTTTTTSTSAPPPPPTTTTRTSMEILHEILQDMQQNLNASHHTDPLASCFVANTSRTNELLVLQQQQQRALPLPTPILNLGMPKCGSTTLYEFFQCAGYNSTHQIVDDTICMRDAVVHNALPPLSTCTPHVQAFLQMDANFPLGFKKRVRRKHRPGFMAITTKRDECFYPQISLLDEIHNEAPNATFILNFRPVQDWIRSVRNWFSLQHRMTLCHIPGLPRGVGREALDLMRWWCSHVLHVRKFVEQYPSHALIELDLYQSDTVNARIMSQLFQIDPNASSCWGHANSSPPPNTTRQRQPRQTTTGPRQKQQSSHTNVRTTDKSLLLLLL